MGRYYREHIIRDSLDRRVITFDDGTEWRLRQKLAEKPWEGYPKREDPDWDPAEAHVVYDCVQTQGPNLGSEAIIKIRIEVPYELPPSSDPTERAELASGMQINSYTENEIDIIKRLTNAGCSVTPQYMASKIEQQDQSILNSNGTTEFKKRFGSVQWWMPGGYIVYILMSKLSAQPLDYGLFWGRFSAEERQEVRVAFREAFLEVRRLGVMFNDCKIENLMWNSETKRCYLIDLEDASYDPGYADPAIWLDGFYSDWNLRKLDAEGQLEL